MDRTPLQRAMTRANWPLILITVALAVYGTMVVSSAVSGMSGSDAMVRRHMIGIAIGVVPLAVAWAVDYRVLRHWTGPILTVMVAMLALVLIPGFGAEVAGAKSWLEIGGFRLFQPSEPAKLLLVLVLASVISDNEGHIEDWRSVGRVFAYMALPLLLIMAEPDLGTVLVFVAITMGMLLVGGMRARYFLVVTLLVSVVVGALIVDAQVRGEDAFLAPYQVRRLTVFVDPDVDTDDAGYNLNQSKIAIGSGGLVGKGLGSGTQSNLNFLPERHTDFIFAVLGEELGFMGVVVLLGLYLALLMVALHIATSSKDLYGALVVSGLIAMWTFQIMVNAGMTMGIMPITGIPLPFMSFGSSFMVTNLGGVGMLLSVWARRYGA